MLSGAPETRSLPNRSTITLVLCAASVAYRAYELNQQARSVPQFVPHQGHPAPTVFYSQVLQQIGCSTRQPPPVDVIGGAGLEDALLGRMNKSMVPQ